MTPKQVLEEARRLIAEEGWVQQSWGEFGTGFCTFSAINKAALTFYPLKPCKNDPAVMTMMDCRRIVFRGLGFSEVGPLVKWNDEPDRTKEQVLEAFDRAIESVE